MSPNAARIVGLDYGRAIAAVFVLLWHEHFFGRGGMFSATATAPFLPNLADILNANILLQAVPFFIFLSCFLYVSKGPSRSSLKRRASRLTTLHIFWGCAYFLVMGGIPALVIALSTFQARPIYATVTAMGSFYFFSALLLTIALTHMASRLSRSWLIALTVFSFALISAMQIATVQYGVPWAAAFWSPLNYLTMPPLVILLVRHLDGRQASSRLIAILGAAFIGVAALEWALVVSPAFTEIQGYAVPAYTRISPAIFCGFAVCLLLRVKRPPGPIISFMSRYALAAYCLQAFVLASTAELGLSVIPKTILDLGGTYLLAYLLGKFVLKDHLLESGHRAPPSHLQQSI